MIFVSLNYLENMEDGRQRCVGSYFGAAPTLDGIADVLREAQRPGLVISDVRVFGDREVPSLYARAKAAVRSKVDQLKGWFRVRWLGFRIGCALRRPRKTRSYGPPPPEHVNCRCVIAQATGDEDFLRPEVGNRRFTTFEETDQ